MADVVDAAAAVPHPFELTRVMVAREELPAVVVTALPTPDGTRLNCCWTWPLLLFEGFHAILALGLEMDAAW